MAPFQITNIFLSLPFSVCVCWGFFPLLLWETRMEEVIIRQNDICELTFFFGEGGCYGKCAIVMKAVVEEHCFMMQTTDIKS